MKQLLLIIIASLILTSCYKTQGPEYYDELDVTLTKYDVNFNFKPTKIVVVKDSVILRHDYLTDKEVKQFYSRGGISDRIVNETKAQFRAKGFLVYGSTVIDDDSTNIKSADLYVNSTVMLSKTTEIYYYPGYGWGWGYGYYGYYGVSPYDTNQSLFLKEDLMLSNRSTDYYYDPYYPPYWGGGYTQYTYETGTLVLEMVEGQSARDYWTWYDGKTKDEIDNTPSKDLPKLKYVWHAFMESILSGDNSYDEERVKRGFNEAFEQSYYLNK